MLAAGRDLWHTFTLAAGIHMEAGHVQGFPGLGMVGNCTSCTKIRSSRNQGLDFFPKEKDVYSPAATYP